LCILQANDLSYGYLQKSGAIALKDRRSLVAPPGRRNRNVPRDYVTVYNDNGGSADGQIMFESLISQGALALDGSGSYAAAGGFTREWDSCSSTVRLHDPLYSPLITAVALVEVEPIWPDCHLR
jgi:chitinase